MNSTKSSEAVVDPETQPFWDATLQGRLAVQACADTGRLIWPPRPMSPWGERRRPIWIEVSGTATIWSFIAPHPPLTPEFQVLAPYNVIVVALTEDMRIRFVGNLIAGEGASINSVDLSTMIVGERVSASFDQSLTNGRRLVRWVRSE